MVRFVCTLALSVLLLLAPAEGRAATLDDLFRDLKAAPDETAAQQLEDRIWRKWTRPDDPQLAGAMADALAALRIADHDRALGLLNGIIRDHPDYAEGYNQRAIVRFLQGKDELSLADIAATLKREPRHFGALSGRALIHLRRGKPALARRNVEAAMEVHPYVRERHLFPDLLKQQSPQ